MTVQVCGQIQDIVSAQYFGFDALRATPLHPGFLQREITSRMARIDDSANDDGKTPRTPVADILLPVERGPCYRGTNSWEMELLKQKKAFTTTEFLRGDTFKCSKHGGGTTSNRSSREPYATTSVVTNNLRFFK